MVTDTQFTVFFSSHLISRNIKIKMYKTIILPVVLYGHEIWSLILNEEYGMRVDEDRVLKLFGPKGEEIRGG
jgi:hypothetical protein